MKRLSPSVLATGVLLAVSPVMLRGQTDMACGTAVSQLQSYVQQVNAVAQFEYYQGIPARCGNNGYCGQVLLQQLTAWYAQQSALVNQWYSTIARQCASKPPAKRTRESDVTSKIDDVDDLEVDDADKTVKIKIPSKPSGYRGRQ